MAQWQAAAGGISGGGLESARVVGHPALGSGSGCEAGSPRQEPATLTSASQLAVSPCGSGGDDTLRPASVSQHGGGTCAAEAERGLAAAGRTRASSRLSTCSSATSAVLEALAEEGAETEQALRLARQQQAAAAQELEAAASERRGFEHQLLQHARSSSKQRRSSGEQAGALAAQLQQARQEVARLVNQCQLEQELRTAAQQLLGELQARYTMAVEEAEVERQQREAVLGHLQAIQSRYAGLADFVWQLDMSQLDPADLAAASEAGAAAAAAAADAATLASLSSTGRGSSSNLPASASLLPFGLPALASQPAANGGAAASMSDAHVQQPSRNQLQAALEAAQQQAAALLSELQRSQHERDAAMYRLDELEQYLRSQQQQEQQQQEEGQQEQQQAGGEAADATSSACSSSSSTPAGSPAKLRQQPQQQQHGLSWQMHHSNSPAGDRLQQLIASLSAAITDLATDDSGGGGPGGSISAAMNGSSSGGGTPAAELQQYCAELQVRVDVLCDQVAAAAAAADQLQQLLVDERAEHRQLQERMAGAGRAQRAARQERLLLQQHVQELEELVSAAISEAEGMRELLEKVSAAEDSSSSSKGGGKLRLGEIWTKLMQAEQRASTALRSPGTSAASSAAGPAGSQPGLHQAWQVLDAATAAAAAAAAASGRRQGPLSKTSSLRDRLSALTRRFSSTTLEAGEVAEAMAAATAAAEAAAPGAAAAAVAVSTSSAEVGAGGDTPGSRAAPTSRLLGGPDETDALTQQRLQVEFASPAAATGTPLLWTGSISGGGGGASSSSASSLHAGRQRLDVSERFSSLLSSLQQRLDAPGLAGAAAAPDSAAAAAAPAAAATSAGYSTSIAMLSTPAQHSLADTLAGPAAAGAATPDSVSWRGAGSGGGGLAGSGGMHGSSSSRWEMQEVAVPVAEPAAAAMSSSSFGGGGGDGIRFTPLATEAAAGDVPAASSERAPAAQHAPAADATYLLPSVSAASPVLDACTQTDPPTVQAAVYLRRLPAAAAASGGSLLTLFIPQPILLALAYIATLLMLPLDRLLFNRWSAAVAAGGSSVAGLAGQALLPMVEHSIRLQQRLRRRRGWGQQLC